MRRLASSSEPEAVARGRVWSAPRLVTSRRGPDLMHLNMRTRGAISTLTVVEQSSLADRLRSDPLLPGQIELRVHAVGLNFRDVLNVLGEYPGDPGPPGGDCAGVVAAAADDVSMRVDASAFGFANGSLASLSRGTTNHLVPLPRTLSFEQACTLPITWSTTHVCFASARCIKRSAVLVHAVAGGVGLVATEYLAWLHVTARGTVGQPYKHAAVRADNTGVTCTSSRNAGAFALGLARGMECKRQHSALYRHRIELTTAIRPCPDC